MSVPPSVPKPLSALIEQGNKHFDLKKWAKNGIYGGTVVMGAQVTYAWGCGMYNKHRVFRRISMGYCSARTKHPAYDKVHLNRTSLLAEVKRLLMPGVDLPSDAYYCILGIPNTGKTTIVRQACSEVGQGVIYMQVQVPDMFGSELAAALDFDGGANNLINLIQNNLIKAIFASGGGSGEKKDDVDKAVEALVEGARKYRRKYKRPPVLVLDDVDSLAQKQPGLLEELQGQAKVWSNEGLIRVVFVLSDGAGLPQMKRRSSWSRANVAGFVRIPDVTDAEAKAYLLARGVSAHDVPKIVAIAGQRIGMLSHAATSIADLGKDTDEVCRSSLDSAADQFDVAGLMDQGRLRDSGLAACRALLDAMDPGPGGERRGIPITLWSRLVPRQEDQKRLFEARIFLKHYPRQAVTFSSRPLAVYAARYLQQLEHEVAGRPNVTGGGELDGDERWKAILHAARLCQPDDGLTKSGEPGKAKASGGDRHGKDGKSSHHPNHHLRKRPVGDVSEAAS